MRVCVIGAGVIGVASAYFLARQGYAVTLVDGRDEPGLVSSYANGGQLSYSYVAPLAGPGVLGDVPAWLLRNDSPLRFRPRLDPHQWRWCLDFALACRASVARRSTAELLGLSYLSRDVLNALLEQEPLRFSHVRNGKLIAYRSAALLEKARGLVAYQASLGTEQTVLSAEETLALEPALAGIGDQLAGAVYTASEEVGDCRQFTQALYQRFTAMPNATVSRGNAVGELRLRGATVVAARCARGDIEADAFVVAAGMGSVDLLRPLGQRVPLYPLKGYSLSVPVADGDRAVPHISVTDYERRIVYARIGPVLRAAAMVDIGDDGLDIDARRIGLLKQQVGETFPHLNMATAVPWAGLRPATPGGKPLIGRSRVADNLWLNLGQGALGFTLACGSAALLTGQMAGISTGVDPAPFLPK